MEAIKCIFCEIESNHVVIEENGYKGKKCPQCGLIYISPRPSFNEVVDLYGHDDAFISAESHISDDFTKRLYARHNLGIIGRFIKHGRLLEVGSGAGYFLDEARKFGFDPYGLEFNPIQANFIRKELNLPCEESPLNSSIFEGKKFDVVYHSDVISHFFDPIEDFRRMHEVMADDAFLIFETGNLGEVDQTYLKYVQYFQYPDHLFFFSPDNLKNLLQRTSFNILKIYRYSIFPQLLFRNKVAGLKHLLKSARQRTQPNGKSNEYLNNSGDEAKATIEIQQPSSERIVSKTALKNLKNYLIYLSRYKLGYVVPKRHQPQTIIVVAQRKATV